jgi:hypothetical protein
MDDRSCRQHLLSEIRERANGGIQEIRALSYLDVASLEAKGADVESKTQQVMAENLSLKQQVDELYRILYMQGIIKQEPYSPLSPSSQ